MPKPSACFLLLRLLSSLRVRVFLALSLLFPLGTGVAEQVSLAWDENTEPDLGGYRIYYGTRPGEYSHTIDAGLAPSAVVDGLEANSTYHFAVTAYNEGGLESEPSESISYRTARIFSAQTFNGLIGEADGEPQGFFTARLSATGSATGRVTLNGKAYGWRGVFDRNGSLTVEVLSRGKRHVASLNLQLSDDGGALTGAVETATGSGGLLGHAVSASSQNPSAGRYTMALAADDSAEGRGYGFGIIKVNQRGLARLTGRLPSGARFGAGVKLDSAATAPLYVFNTSTRRTIAGRISFREVAGESDADGVLRVHRSGIGGMEDEVIGLQAARYPGADDQAGASSATAAPPRLVVQLTLTGDAQVSAELTAGRRMVGRAASGEGVTMRVSSRTGLFSGICTAPGKPRARFAGAMYHKGEFRGFGRVHVAGGSVELRQLAP